MAFLSAFNGFNFRSSNSDPNEPHSALQQQMSRQNGERWEMKIFLRKIFRSSTCWAVIYCLGKCALIVAAIKLFDDL